jgi:hypothetical protein
MHSRGAYAAPAMTFVKSHGEEDVCRLRSAIRDEGLIGRPLKIGILEIDIGEAVTRGSQIDQPSFLADERRNPIDKNKVSQVISAELRLKAVRRMAKRCGHYSRIGDDHVEGFTFCEQSIGAGSHALKIGQIERKQLEASTIGRRIRLYLRGRRFSLDQIPCRTDDLRALRGKGAGSLHADPSGNASDEDPFALEIHA